MNNTTNKIILNGKELSIAAVLNAFTIHEKPSSNVAYFGTDIVNNKIFVQFKSGSSYIYTDVPAELLEDIQTAESVGKFYVKNIANKFQNLKFPEKLVNVVSVLD